MEKPDALFLCHRPTEVFCTKTVTNSNFEALTDRNKETPCGHLPYAQRVWTNWGNTLQVYLYAQKHVRIKERGEKVESLEEIYQKHAQTVYAYLLSRTRNSDLAEELTQETFFQAVRSIGTFQRNSSITTWLCGIAKNLLRQHIRESSKTQSLEEMEGAAGTSGPEEELCLQWDSLEVLKLLHKLKEPVREVMYLRLIGNLNFGQIGEIMGKSENWARVNFYRGKERIRKEALKHEE